MCVGTTGAIRYSSNGMPSRYPSWGGGKNRTSQFTITTKGKDTGLELNNCPSCGTQPFKNGELICFVDGSNTLGMTEFSEWKISFICLRLGTL